MASVHAQQPSAVGPASSQPVQPTLPSLGLHANAPQVQPQNHVFKKRDVPALQPSMHSSPTTSSHTASSHRSGSPRADSQSLVVHPKIAHTSSRHVSVGQAPARPQRATGQYPRYQPSVANYFNGASRHVTYHGQVSKLRNSQRPVGSTLMGVLRNPPSHLLPHIQSATSPHSSLPELVRSVHDNGMDGERGHLLPRTNTHGPHKPALYCDPEEQYRMCPPDDESMHDYSNDGDDDEYAAQLAYMEQLGHAGQSMTYTPFQ
jgi:hypothetical protein